MRNLFNTNNITNRIHVINNAIHRVNKAIVVILKLNKQKQLYGTNWSIVFS